MPIRALYPLDHILVFNHGNERGDVPFVGLNTLRTQHVSCIMCKAMPTKYLARKKKEKIDVNSSLMGNAINFFSNGVK
jgi:hypothetical protein